MLLLSDSRFLCYNFPLSINSESELIENYYCMLENDDAITNIFRTMANSIGGVLFYCQEGKDRTGVISALLLLLAKVSDIDIYADYEISNVYLYDKESKSRFVRFSVVCEAELYGKYIKIFER